MKAASVRPSQLIAIVITFWFLVVIDSVFVWNSLERILRIMSFLVVMFASMMISMTRDRESLKRAYSFFLFGSIFTAWLTAVMSDTLNLVFSNLIRFLPLLAIVFWPSQHLSSAYRMIRRVVLFFAIGGSIISILTLTGLISYIPHYALPPRETLHIKLGYFYYVYGIFPTLQDPAMTQAPRVCGMMREPGHFAILLGFIYLIDRFQGKRINLWFILAGILTFSANFFIIIAITELRYLFVKRIFTKILQFSAYISLFAFAYFILPSEFQARINYLFYERNLKDVIEALNTSSSLSEGLDERANVSTVSIYENISNDEFLMGGVKFDTADSLADYRGLILRIGVIGIILSFLAYYSTTKQTSFYLRLSLLLLFGLILIHRSWMLQLPYPYFLSYLAVVINSQNHIADQKEQRERRDDRKYWSYRRLGSSAMR